jgi:hypothetical protein
MPSTQPAAVIERLLDDDYVHEQIAAAGSGLRDAYRRAGRLPPWKAAQDKTVYDRLRRAATGLIEAARRATGKPRTKAPGRRRGLLVLVLLAAGAVVFFATKTRRHAQSGDEAPVPGTAQPASTPTPPPARAHPGAAPGGSSPTSGTQTDQ